MLKFATMCYLIEMSYHIVYISNPGVHQELI